MNSYGKKSFALICALLMTAMIFQNVAAEDEYNTGEDMDIFVDSFGNEHQVWRESVNGTYQIFYGYQIVDTVYNENSANYFNQTLGNVIFNDGFLNIINCTVNGNVIVTEGNVVLQDCNIIGNVNINLGRLKVINCDINGNLDVKNADLEIRYSRVNGYLYPKQSSFEDYSEIIIGNDIIGNVIIKGGTCYIVGNTINGNLDINDPTIIQQVIDNDVNGNTKLNDNTEGFIGYQITNSTQDVQYPQCVIDSITNLGYIFWLKYGVELYYLGTEDFVTWSQPTFLGVLSVTDNPELDVSATNGTLTINWEYDGTRTYESDLDWDFIPDSKDSFPMEYNIISGDSTFITDAVTFDTSLGISVAIDYAGNATVAPSIVPIYMPPLAGSIGTYVNITTTCNQSFTAYVKWKYDESQLSENIIEKYIRGYHYKNESWLILKNTTSGEDTGIDMECNYFWFKVPDFSIFTFMDSSTYDSDHDGLYDAEEINADGAPDATIVTFSDSSTSKSLYLRPDEPQTLTVDIPIYFAGTERIGNSNIAVNTSIYAFNQKHILTSPSNSRGPDIYQEKIVYMDDRNGNYDIYLMDLNTGIESQITDDPSHDAAPKIWGDYVFWYRTINMLFVKNYITGEEWQVGNGGSGEIYNNYIVWPGTLYDIFTQTTRPLNGSGTPHICRDYVAFVDYISNELRVYRISTDTTIAINPVGLNPFLLDISERYVLYQDSNEYELYVYDLFSEETIQITDNSYVEDDPTIYGDTAVWCDHRDSSNWNIYGFDLVNNKEFLICTAQNKQEDPTIFEDTIIWSDYRDEVQWQLYSAIKTTPKMYISIGGQNNVETDIINGQCSIPDISQLLNEYLKSHDDSDDGTTDGMITIPISFFSNGAGSLDINQLLFELYIVATDPLDEDTDNDGLWDGYNVVVDNQTHTGEKSFGTNPLKIFSDSDTLNDYDEVVTYGTNPNNPDTDADLLKDGVEIQYYMNLLGESTFWNSFWGTDIDGDGRKNGPFDTDTDGDGISDTDEINSHYTVDYTSKMVPFSVNQIIYNQYQIGAWIYNLKPWCILESAICSYTWSNTGGRIDSIEFGYQGGTPIYLSSGIKTGTVNLLNYWDKATLLNNLNWYFRIHYTAIENTWVTISQFTIKMIGATNPTLNDTDFDRLNDKDERDYYYTSPINPDSDFDMLTDGQEVLDMWYTAPTLSFIKSGNFGGYGSGIETEVIAVLFNVVGHPVLSTVYSIFTVTDWGGVVRNSVSLSLRHDSSSYYAVSSKGQDILSLFGESAFLSSHTWYLKATYQVGGDMPASFTYKIQMAFVAMNLNPLNKDTDGDGCIDSSDEFPVDPAETADTDKDGIGNEAELDDDGDGFYDIEDQWPLNPTGAIDSDYDGKPDVLLPQPWWWVPTYLNTLIEDLDDDNDRIPDIIEGEGDPNGNGIPNRLDLNSDNDGIPDAIEAGPDPTNPTNTDGLQDGSNFLDDDSDEDGIPDIVEGNIQWDQDGIPNYMDLDSDGDEKPDADEYDANEDGIADDTDSDNIPDYLDNDDSSGPTGDSDGDGVPNNVEGITDSNDNEIPDYLDPDDDGDGILTKYEDINGDGDPTNDNSDGMASTDYTSDTKFNYLDRDDDGDGVLTENENPDPNGDDNPSDAQDTGGLLLADYLDYDDDGDGVPTKLEDLDGNGDPRNDNTNYCPASETSTDYISDDDPNYLDTDDDGDSIQTTDEDLNGDGIPTNDHTDNDGTPNYLDRDDDGDKLSTLNEIDYFGSILTGDIDIDGKLNGPFDDDTDGDGYPDGFDLDPLIDLTITMKITEISQIDEVDDDTDGDYYLWVNCDRAQKYVLGTLLPGYWSVSKKSNEPIRLDNGHVNPSGSDNAEFAFNVPDNEEIRAITIYLFDDDEGLEDTITDSLNCDDDICDISMDYSGGDESNPDSSTLDLNYKLKGGYWYLDDSRGDSNGYGHASGNQDGSGGAGDDEDDCELWFDITQNDYDADGLTWWQEVRERAPGEDAYGTDPTDWDTDGDGLCDREALYFNRVDGDEMSAQFEINEYKTNPGITNEQFALLLCTEEDWEFANYTADLLRDHYNYPVNNIYKLNGMDASYGDFQLQISDIANRVNEHSIVFIGISSHGYDGGMFFNDGGNTLGEKVSYFMINYILSAINCMQLIIMIDNCDSGSAIKYMSIGPCPRAIYTSSSTNEESDPKDFEVHFTLSLGLSGTSYDEADHDFGNDDGYVSLREAFLYSQYHTLNDGGDETPEHAMSSCHGKSDEYIYLGEYQP